MGPVAAVLGIQRTGGKALTTRPRAAARRTAAPAARAPPRGAARASRARPAAPAAAGPAAPDPRLAAVAAAIRTVEDFPKPGVSFKDVGTLLLDPLAFGACIDLLAERYRGARIDAVAGFEARGFIFGPPLALALGAPFVMIRKAGKLPGETVGEDYATEYSTARIEIQKGALRPGQRVLLVDDLVATGGTLAAGASLVRRLGAVAVEAACVVELPGLGGRAAIGGLSLFALIGSAGSGGDGAGGGGGPGGSGAGSGGGRG
ncbi:adenine phosphoribosyltransferase [Raphidocelis subcapitata]|uniref:adenine phosphoribosyltransferase n=1 Tax=Raphidocelis subcapitata TaxID=307507 RepID=A0A2V0NMS8_9CHLO|nr:adenine phosphoribosyltransferase [Raphidocelis subcapitata]|eukprot:GBF87732.1 adenine phosphoribosyltransferase [Raphidocelis subcapitata]